MKEVKTDLVEILAVSKKQLDESAVVAKAKADAIQEVINFIETNKLVIYKQVEESEEAPKTSPKNSK